MDFDTIKAQLAISTNKSISQSTLAEILRLKLKKNIMGISLEDNIVSLIAEVVNSGLDDEQCNELLGFMEKRVEAALDQTRDTIGELFGQKKASAETDAGEEASGGEIEGDEEE